MQFPPDSEQDPQDAAPQPPRTPTRRSARYSPSLPNIYFPMRYAPRFFDSDEDIVAFTAQRPHLGSLDLASPLLRAMPRVVRTSLDSAPITPPLTPESAANSDASSVKSHLDLYKFPPLHVQQSLEAPASPSHPPEIIHPEFTSLQSRWSHRPAVIRTHSISFLSKAASRHEPDLSSLQSLLAFPAAGDSESSPVPCGRFLLVTGVPNTADSQELREAFSPCGDTRGIFRYQEECGAAILVFYNARQCADSVRLVHNKKLFPDNVTLSARCINAAELRKALPGADFVAESEAELRVSTQGHVDVGALHNIFTSFGELQSFIAVDPTEKSPAEFRVEYYDCRDSFNAFSQLNNRTILNTRLGVEFVDQQAHAIAMDKVRSASQPLAPIGSSPSRQTGDHGHRRITGGAHSGNSPHGRHSQSRASGGNGLHHANSEQNLNTRVRGNGRQNGHDCSRRGHGPVGSQGVRRQASTLDMHGAGGRAQRIPENDGEPTTETRKPGVPSPCEGRLVQPGDAPAAPGAFVVSTASHAAAPYTSASPTSPDHASSFAQSIPQYEFDAAVPLQRKLSWDEEINYLHQMQAYGALPPHAMAAQVDQMLRHQAVFVPGPNMPQPHGGVIPTMAHPPRLPLIDTSIETYYSASSTAACTPTSITPLTSMTDGTPPRSPSIFTPTEYTSSAANTAASNERNILDLGKVERGEDTRTTVMIKNIPNKMTDKNLIDFINDVCFRRIDFLYLRMDFMNNCNVGYAFVNFMSVHDLLDFAKAKLGVKWNMCSSQKVLQMTYANYQGKEALVEKFKNSCIMDERESWRPKIFYSSGPKQGMPEPFPAPTHMKRKERSQANARERVLFAHQPRHQRGQLTAAQRSPVYGHA